MARSRVTADGAFGGILAVFGILVLIAFVAAVFLVGPGAIAFCTIADLSEGKFDSGQMWAFSCTISAAVFAGLFAWRRDVTEATQFYFGVCVAVAGIYALSHYGFKVDFPLRHWNYFFEPTVS
ncbi:MAG: hypothetical protein V4709_06045 [Pseudomonadota bacterium]